jgi:hypothetical protein
MTGYPQIPQDDLLDVVEMTQKLENYITKLLKGNELNLSISALISATINCLLGQCKTFDEVMFYRNFFMEVFDNTIRTIKIKKPEKPSQ